MSFQYFWHRIKLTAWAARLAWTWSSRVLIPEPVIAEPTAREQQRQQQLQQRQQRQEKRQLRCTLRGHRKGGLHGPKSMVGDPNIHMHTFIGGDIKIWCGKGCGWEIWSRPGQPLPDDWEKALAMVDLSTNSPSSSEVPNTDGPTEVMRQPVHGHDEFFGEQIPLKPDDHPIKGYRGSKMVVPEPAKGIQDITTGEIFTRGENGEALSYGIYPIVKDSK